MFKQKSGFDTTPMFLKSSNKETKTFLLCLCKMSTQSRNVENFSERIRLIDRSFKNWG